MSFSSWLFNRRLRKLSRVRRPIYKQFSAINSVVVLLPEATNQEAAKQLLNGKEIYFIPEPTKEQISFWTQRPKNAFFQQENFLTKQFDLLLDLHAEPQLPIEYIVFECNAAFKCGLYLREGLYDMTLATTQEDNTSILQEIIHYLQTIRQK